MGKSIRFLLFGMLMTAFVMAFPIKANAEEKIEITSLEITTIPVQEPVYGETVLSYDGSVGIRPKATITSCDIDGLKDSLGTYVSWNKKIGYSYFQLEISPYTFSSGSYTLCVCVSLPDALIDSYIFKLSTDKVKINGEQVSSVTKDQGGKVFIYSKEWILENGPAIDDHSRMSISVYSDWGAHACFLGKEITKSINVTGGTAPYTFEKISGPDWLNVETKEGSDGKIGLIKGTPTTLGENDKLIIKVTDKNEKTSEQEFDVFPTTDKFPLEYIKIGIDDKFMSAPELNSDVKIPTVKSFETDLSDISESEFSFRFIWQKKNGSIFKDFEGAKFTSGIYRLTLIVEYNNTATHTNSISSTQIYVNGQITQSASSVSTMKYVYFKNLLTVEGGELVYNSTYSINTVIHNTAVTNVELTASGGVEPYTFEKVSGPSWINVSSYGVVGGVPDNLGTNEDLVVKLTDSNSKSITTTIPVANTLDYSTQYTITFDANGYPIYLPDNITDTAGKNRKINPPSFSGYYTFDGWYTEPDCINKVGSSIDLTGDIILYAKMQGKISKATIYGIADQTYTGSEITPEPIVKFNGNVLEKDKDYTLSYENNIEVSTGADLAKIIITGIKDYCEEQTVTFRIKPVPTPTPTSTPTPEVTPTPTSSVTPDATPTPSTDVSPSTAPTSNPDATPTPGTEVAPTPTSGVEATPTPGTDVTPTATPGTEDSSITLPKVVTKKPKNKKGKKIYIKWGEITGADGYEVQYSLKKSFSKAKKAKTKIKSTTKTSYTIKKLTKKKTYYVRVRAYKLDANNQRIYGKWSKAKKVKVKK